MVDFLLALIEEVTNTLGVIQFSVFIQTGSYIDIGTRESLNCAHLFFVWQ